MRRVISLLLVCMGLLCGFSVRSPVPVDAAETKQLMRSVVLANADTPLTPVEVTPEPEPDSGPAMYLTRSFAPSTGQLYYLEIGGTPQLDDIGVVDPDCYNDFTVIYEYKVETLRSYTRVKLHFACAYRMYEVSDNDSAYIWFNPRLQCAGQSFFMDYAYLIYVYYVTDSGKVYRCPATLKTGNAEESGIYVPNPYPVVQEQGTFYIDSRQSSNYYNFIYNGKINGDYYAYGHYPNAKMSLTSVCYSFDAGQANGYPLPNSKWEETTDFVVPSMSPDAGPATTPAPAGTPAPPLATSDPVLGEINDNINNQMQQDQEQHEETKGLLATIIDGITGIPGKIIDLLINALKALFIPSDGYLTTKMDEVTKTLEEHLGFLAFPVRLLNDILQMVNNYGGSGSGKFELPAATLNMNGQQYTIWSAQTFDISTIFNNFPDLQDHLYTASNFICFVCVLLFAVKIIRRYIPVDGSGMIEELSVDTSDYTDDDWEYLEKYSKSYYQGERRKKLRDDFHKLRNGGGFK